jgi:hypothetical protein
VQRQFGVGFARRPFDIARSRSVPECGLAVGASPMQRVVACSIEVDGGLVRVVAAWRWLTST